MTAIRHRLAALVLLILPACAASACESGSFPLFGCEAAKGRKFIELCAPSPVDEKTGYLRYRFGSLDNDGNEKAVELEFPAEDAGSFKRFYGATYTQGGVYTQSVRFALGNFGYTVYTRSRGMQTINAGVEVRDRKSGKTSVVSCSERPRFYIYELQGIIPCDPETPVGRACIK